MSRLNLTNEATTPAAIEATETIQRAAGKTTRPRIHKRTLDEASYRAAQKAPEGVWWGELDSMVFPARGWLVRGLLKERTVAMVYSGTGIGKTWFTLSLAMLMAGGGSMLDRFGNDRPRRVLLIDGEMPLDALQERIKALSAGLGCDEAALRRNLLIYPRQNQSPDSQFIAIDDPEWQQGVVEQMRDFDCVIFDNFSTLSRVEDENSAAEVRGVNDLLLKIKQMNRSAILVHHQNKNKTGGEGSFRGSSNLSVVLNLILRLERDPDADLAGTQGARFLVAVEKNRDNIDLPQLPLKLVQNGQEWPEGGPMPVRWEVDDESGNSVERFVRTLEKGGCKTYAEVAQVMGIHANTVTKIAQRALATGAIDKLRIKQLLDRARKAGEVEPDEDEEVEVSF